MYCGRYGGTVAPDAIAVAESDEKQLEAQVELGDTEEDIETHIVQLSDKKVSVRYNFSFQAKLIQAPAEVQRRYGLLTELLGQYSLLNSVQSWKQLCYYVRRNPRCVGSCSAAERCVLRCRSNRRNMRKQSTAGWTFRQKKGLQRRL